ncbi:hypothetical protein TRICI_002752 [Trichomonascus ciferrii]|uniref:non-specific serine/threonine protein kinase n=1 Tax=Trichomonascus ciferrii TaxID=44093 RepID=A0A642VAX9_9ASCO|nr:hypothetical protein TRICI_002752 [Trichomonascus ciferrii]
MNPPVTSLYRRDEAIGRGNFGVVYKGVSLETNQVVAIKVLDLDTAEDEILDIQQEISTLSKLSHSDASNITTYYGSYLHGTKLWIIMELCIGGSVRTLLKAGRLEEKYMSIIAREVLVGLSFIHREGIIHRDIKAANILVTNEGKVRLCDFGVAAQVTANKLKRSTIVGTPYWMAPEVITEGALYNTKADIWSLGITMYEIATGNPPYSDQEAFRAIMLIPRQKPARLEGSTYSPALKEFVAHCLDEHPDERPSAEELGKMKFIKSSRNIPTSSLREVVARYMSWRERNRNVRDSVAILKEAQNNNGRRMSDASSIYSTNSDPDADNWDFDTSDDTTFDYADQPLPSMDPQQSSPDSMSYSPSDEAISESYPSTQNNTMIPQQSWNQARSQESTFRGTVTNAASTADAPKSLIELFEDDIDPPTSESQQPTASNSVMPSPNIDTFPSYQMVPPHPPASAPPPPINGSPPVEIEIPTFDSMDAESSSAAAAALSNPTPTTTATSSGAVLARTASYSQTSTQLPAATRSARSNTVGSVGGSNANLPATAPPVPPIPMAQTGPKHPPLQQTQSQPTLQTNQMLPPQMPHSIRRTPSPKRMTPKPSTTAPKSAGSSPPKPSTVMKPLNRTKTDEEEQPPSTNNNSNNNTHSPNQSPPIDGSNNSKQSLRKPAALNRGGKLHIAMPPPSLPISSNAPSSASAALGSSTTSRQPTVAGPSSSSATLADDSTTGGLMDDPITFPSVPKFDPSTLLDTTSRTDTVAHLEYLLDAFSAGLASIEEGLYNFVK